MPFLSPVAIWSLIFLAFTNLVTLTLWRVEVAHHAMTKADLVAAEAKHDAFVAQVEAQGKIAAEKAAAKEKEYERVARETATAWDRDLAAVRSLYDKRLRLAASGSAGGGGVSPTATTGLAFAGPDADSIPSPERIAADCAETTLTANALQDYLEQLEQQK